MSQGKLWLRISRRRNTVQNQAYRHDSAEVLEQTFLRDVDDLKPIDKHRCRKYLAAQNLFYGSNLSCNTCCLYMAMGKLKWLATGAICLAGVAMSFAVWSSNDSALLGLSWPWGKSFPAPAAANLILLLLVGVMLACFAPAMRESAGRPVLPLRARTIIFYTWLLLNLYWFVEGIRYRDFQKKPKWLKHRSAQPLSESTAHLLRLSYGVGMAACWPLLANLFVVLLPVDRTLLLLSCLGVGHEDGVLSHALCGTAVWCWATAHALLTQGPMLAAGLWRVIMLPPRDGSEGKGISNFMGLMAWLLLCGLGASSLAPVRRAAFNTFLRLHLLLAPAILLMACLHDSKVFWYGMLGAVLYGADLVQRIVLRRRAAVATATVYPLALQPLSPSLSAGRKAAVATAVNAVAAAAARSALEDLGAAAAAAIDSPQSAVATAAATAAAAAAARSLTGCDDGGGEEGGGSSSSGGGGVSFVVLRVPTGGPPGCCAGQHIYLKVPSVSRWEWHPYSVAAHDDSGFAVVVKAGGDWERRLCGELRRRAAKQQEQQGRGRRGMRPEGAAAAAGSGHSAHIEVQYEGLYGTPDLQAAAAAADRVLLFAGGAGITPIASVLQSLLLQTQMHTPQGPHPHRDPPSHRGVTTRQPQQQQQQLLPPAGGRRVGVAAASADHDSKHGNRFNGYANGHTADVAAGTTPGFHGLHLDAVKSGFGEQVPTAVAVIPAVSSSPLTTDAAAATAGAAVSCVAASAMAAAVRRGARVHLVWSVTQQSDAQPLLPLLRAASAAGWSADLHCTRQLPPAPLAAFVCSDGGTAVPLLQPPLTAAANGTATATADQPPLPPAEATAAAAPVNRFPKPPLSNRVQVSAGKGAVEAATEATAPPPWHLNGAACWAVAAFAAVLGGLGRALGGGVMGTQHCDVAADTATLAAVSAASAAAGGGGSGASTSTVSAAVKAWVASVRQAFTAVASLGSSSGGDGSTLGMDEALETSGSGPLRRLVSSLIHLTRDGCPATLDPSSQHYMHAHAQQLGDLHGSGVAKAAGVVSLRVCRVYGMPDPELCVKCDPFKTRSPLEQMWPCCSAPVCYYGTRLAPLLGWVLGVALGALMACLVWRLWRQRRAVKLG
ncbi:hypothetical protein Agub_g12130, partial [Astrephomene gubernaculifera]